MATAYLIDNTAGTHSFVVLPGSLNGPGSVSHETDLRLYGLGAFSWGEGINENFYRLTENFACPESVLNPGNPMDAAELGRPGHGINDPIQGQLWFNTTSNTMMVFNGTTWISIGGTIVDSVAPTSPQPGNLWYDTITEQLMIWNGTAWESVADRYVLKTGDTMTGPLTLSGDPTDPMHAATKQYADTKVSKSGDTMSNFLTLHDDPNFPMHAATKQYVDSVLTGAINGAPVLLTGKTFVPLDNSVRIFSLQRTTMISTQTYTRTINIANSVTDIGATDATVPTTIVNAFPVPANTTHVLVRFKVNANVNIDVSNYWCFLEARKEAPDAYVQKIFLEPTRSGAGIAEGEQSVTVVMAVSATNTIDINWYRNLSDAMWSFGLAVDLEGYYIQDQTGGMTQTDADARYVNVTGDTMTGNLNMGSNRVNFGALFLNEGNGSVGVAPDIRANASLSLGADQQVYVLVDGTNDGNGGFYIRKGALTTGGSTPMFSVINSGRIQSEIANYETLVTTNNSIPNKKYVDDKVAAGPSTGKVLVAAKWQGNGASAPIVQYTYNVSSITRIGTGVYRITFTTALPTHYAAVGDCGWGVGDATHGFYFEIIATATTYIDVGLIVNGWGNDNRARIGLIIAR